MTLKNILVVEEDHNLRQSIVLMLQHAGYQVTAIGSTSEAAEMIRSGKFHLVMLDTMTPETKQVLLPKILALYPYLSIVFLTDRPLAEAKKENKLVFVNYLEKPIDPESLMGCVKTMLA